MSVRAAPPQTYDNAWTQWVNASITALQRGDNFTGTVSVGRLLVGAIYIDDSRDAPQAGGTPADGDSSVQLGVRITDSKSGASCLLPIPCPPEVPPPSGGSGVGAVFDFPGPLQISISDAFASGKTVQFTGIMFSLRVASPSSTISVGVFKNGGSIGTVTIPAGASLYNYVSGITLNAATDTLQLRILSPGIGASGLIGATY
jgi:hypothetical protein